MATKNPRLLVTLDLYLYQWIKEMSKNAGISMSLVLRDIIKKQYQDEAWFWTEAWQEKEKEANEDIKNKKYKDFDSAEELIKDLKS